MSHNYKFLGHPYLWDPLALLAPIATSFRDTPMGSQSGAMPRANGNLVICRAKVLPRR
jgi:hypothetical protein